MGTTFLLLSIGISGCLQIEERLDFNVFLPTDSSVAKFFRKHDQEFPNDGYVADIFIQGDPIRNRTLLKRVDLLVAKLQRLVDEGQVLRGEFSPRHHR